MAPLATAPQTPPSSQVTTGRSRPRGRPPGSSSQAPNGATDSPQRKRKYIPGGPGGGGRYIEVDGNEALVGGIGSGGSALPGAQAGDDTRDVATPSATSRRRKPPAAPTPRYSSAAAAAARVAQNDDEKPREERGWEEIHPHLDIEATFAVYSAAQVDGVVAPTIMPSLSQANLHQADKSESPGVNGLRSEVDGAPAVSPDPSVNDDDIVFSQPKKRRVGRPSRRPEPAPAAENAILSTPKIIPPPGPTPGEKLILNKPSFRHIDPFQIFEQKGTGQARYVDRSMANVGYQESDLFIRPESTLIRYMENTFEEDLDLVPGLNGDGDGNAALGVTGVGRVEYDMDEQDDDWLATYNDSRKQLDVEPITREIFEITMTKIEKEWYSLEKRIPKPNPKPPQTHRPRSGSAAAVNGEPVGATGEEQDTECTICDDGEAENSNVIVFCDGCDIAVHQECYGVPLVPEGQWLCRKCQLVGRATPTCIFCPNTDGAFKQTNSSLWAHLLCAIWIPEVTIANTTFQEPIVDVEKVPKSRWKLTCYICRQKMGACIQCKHKNCCIAFHVTCGKRARLFMKRNPVNKSESKAFCDKHVPAEWRRENDVQRATAEAQAFYRRTMRGRLWADGHQAAITTTPVPVLADSAAAGQSISVVPRLHLTMGGNKRKANQQPKTAWRLPSGAPVVPHILYNSVEASLQRFGIRKRKEYVADACKYWTLKREARRGAALLKRLQLQMEIFTSMEVTRRNYVAMGASGRVRLQRRIDFATSLIQDLERLRLLCDEVKKREKEKLKDVELLKDVVDIVYFPISALLWPILERAQSLDSKGVYAEGLANLRSKLEVRYYTSVNTFSKDFGAVFSSALMPELAGDNTSVHAQLNGGSSTSALTPEQKEHRKLAKRIIKSLQGALEEAVRMEAELGRRPFERELKQLDLLLEQAYASRGDSRAVSFIDDRVEVSMSEPRHPENEVAHDGPTLNGAQAEGMRVSQLLEEAINGENHPSTATAGVQDVENPATDVTMEDTLGPENAHNHSSHAVQRLDQSPEKRGVDEVMKTNNPGNIDKLTNGHPPPKGESGSLSDENKKHQPVLDTPYPDATEDLLAPLSHGGIAWYMDPFDPDGTTIYEERWTGREVVRGMSGELSELDDDELEGLVDEEMEAGKQAEAGVKAQSAQDTAKKGKPARKKAKTPRRWRGYR